jgi:hypothetical protein
MYVYVGEPEMDVRAASGLSSAITRLFVLFFAFFYLVFLYLLFSTSSLFLLPSKCLRLGLKTVYRYTGPNGAMKILLRTAPKERSCTWSRMALCVGFFPASKQDVLPSGFLFVIVRQSSCPSAGRRCFEGPLAERQIVERRHRDLE